jgi:hypothetical protein
MAGDIIYSVFVSSTYEDLREERAAVQKALLQLHCMPIGMELFGSDDEETWEVIKRQINDCDYFVVIVADKYGSVADDGISYTEKEYDYAREVKKPVLAFVHGNRGGIVRDKTESDPGKRSKLDAFIEKVRRSPVSFFTAPHDLATQVTVSFVNLRERRPAIGFIRADQAPDLRKYADLLEENKQLRAELDARKQLEIQERPFRHASTQVTIPRKVENRNENIDVTWGELFFIIADRIIHYGNINIDNAISDLARRKSLIREDESAITSVDTENLLTSRLIGWRLVDKAGGGFDLTEYGKAQYGLFMI